MRASRDAAGDDVILDFLAAIRRTRTRSQPSLAARGDPAGELCWLAALQNSLYSPAAAGCMTQIDRSQQSAVVRTAAAVVKMVT
jgi:hypothetical protein